MASTSTSSASSSDSEHEQPAVTKRKVKEVKAKDDSDESSDSSESEAGDVEPTEEVPVLSHAELRRQKRKGQKAKESAEKKEDADTKSKQKKVKNTAELAPSKIPKRQNSVWIGNLSFKTTPDALRQFFDGVGEITRVHMPMKMATGGPGRGGAVKENRGFAYVDFASPEAKTIAITLSENHLDGRRLLIKDGDDYSGRPSTSTQADGAATTDGEKNLTGHTKTAQKILRQQKQPAGPTLFLGNLGFETTEQSIRSLFESHHVKEVKAEDKEAMDVDQKDGDVKEVKEKGAKNWIRKIRMGTFEDSGKCKGWAFVDFLTTEDATTALVNPKNHFLDGRKLVVEYGSPEAVRRGGAGSRGDKGKGRPSSGPSKQDEEGTEGSGKPRRERVRPVRKRDAEDGEEQPAKRRKSEGEGADGGAEEGGAGAYPSRREMRGSRDARPKVRAKPGAALANAKREAVSIVPSQGKKIVF